MTRRIRWIFGVSIGLNVVLAGAFAWRAAQPADRTVDTKGSTATDVDMRAQRATEICSAARAETDPTGAWRNLHSDDLKAFATNLRLAGLSDPLVRAIISAEIDERYRAREAALKPHRPQTDYWQFDDFKEPLETKVARLDLRREKTRLLLDVMGADPLQPDSGGIPPKKHELARAIAEDYDTLIAEVRLGPETILLPSERRMLEQLEGEKHRELEELLTRQELTEFIVRTSPAGQYLRQQLRGFQPTEAEFRAIFEEQNEYEGTMKMARLDVLDATRRDVFTIAQEKMEEELRASLGEDRYRTYVRERDPELRMLRDLASRVGVSRQDAERVYDLRDFITRESKRIGDDDSSSVESRQSALAELARATRSEIQTVLGSEASAAYLRGADGWLNEVERGNVVELRPGGMTSHSVDASRRSARPPPPRPPSP